MATKTTLVEILHDTGYGEDVLFYLNLALRGKDMRAIRVVDVSASEEYKQKLARVVLEQSINPTCAVPRPFVDWEEK